MNLHNAGITLQCHSNVREKHHHVASSRPAKASLLADKVHGNTLGWRCPRSALDQSLAIPMLGYRHRSKCTSAWNANHVRVLTRSPRRATAKRAASWQPALRCAWPAPPRLSSPAACTASSDENMAQQLDKVADRQGALAHHSTHLLQR